MIAVTAAWSSKIARATGGINCCQTGSVGKASENNGDDEDTSSWSWGQALELSLASAPAPGLFSEPGFTFSRKYVHEPPREHPDGLRHTAKALPLP